MPKLWKFRSKGEQEDDRKVEEYHFADAQDLPGFEENDLSPGKESEFTYLIDDSEDSEEEARFMAEPLPPDEELQSLEEPESAVRREKPEENPVYFAQIQADKILEDAELRAAEILAEAESQAKKTRDLARKQGEDEGYQAGFQQGLAEGTSKALQEGQRAKEETAEKMIADVEAFLWKAEQTLNRQMDENLTDLRDLALAVAEKVVCVSLKSSSEVIGRMIQTAVAKRKRREWAHIYIAECDAKKLTTMPASLAAALSELSDRVQIIPMVGDEAGTCLIESPEEIIDASASTQMQNIRDLLSSRGGSGMTTNFSFSERSRNVSTNDPTGI